MKELYDLLDKLLELSNLSEICNLITKNYNLFLKLNKLEYIKIDSKNFHIGFIKKKDKSNNNIYLMFKLFHYHFLKLLSKNCDRLLNYDDEIVKYKKNNHKFIVIVTNTKIKLNIYKVYLLIYYLERRINRKNHYYLPIDFEFNTKVVALMQINFEQLEIDLYKHSLIVLFEYLSDINSL